MIPSRILEMVKVRTGRFDIKISDEILLDFIYAALVRIGMQCSPRMLLATECEHPLRFFKKDGKIWFIRFPLYPLPEKDIDIDQALLGAVTSYVCSDVDYKQSLRHLAAAEKVIAEYKLAFDIEMVATK